MRVHCHRSGGTNIGWRDRRSHNTFYGVGMRDDEDDFKPDAMSWALAIGLSLAAAMLLFFAIKGIARMFFGVEI